MLDRPAALIIRTAGTNCDVELARAFELAGAAPEARHIDNLARDPAPLASAPIIAFPGGFSYGDDIAAGRVLAVKIRQRLWAPLRDAIDRGALIIGVCNGFQVITQLGLLPGCAPGRWPGAPDAPPTATIALAENATGRFIDRWCRMRIHPTSNCIWTTGLDAFDATHMMLPVAHGEGRVIGQPELIDRLIADGQAPLRYADADNPNGSSGAIAGLSDPSGRIFGLMPHPERFLSWRHHPASTRFEPPPTPTPGLLIFANAVAAARERVPVA